MVLQIPHAVGRAISRSWDGRVDPGTTAASARAFVSCRQAFVLAHFRDVHRSNMAKRSINLLEPVNTVRKIGPRRAPL
jgi:hypothetical protein